MYGIWHKYEGLQAIAKRIRFRSEVLRDNFKSLGIVCINHANNFFDTLTIECKASGLSSADHVVSEFNMFNINLRKIDDNTVSISLNETTTIKDLAELIEIFALIK